jgi:hypothetical protein
MNVKQLREALRVLPDDLEVVLEVTVGDIYAYPSVNAFGITEEGEVVLFCEPEGTPE